VPEATAAAAAPVATAPSATKSATEEEGWAGENAAKNGDAKPAASPDAAPVSAPAADPKAPETRTMEVIRKLVVDNRKAARKCYEDARKDLKDLKGDVVVHFVIDPDGNVKSTELNQERSTLKSPAVVDCVLGVIKGIKFPKSSRAMETSTNYPFNFTP
jgi:outer membrane biosynthesis protein TonB